jgi:hypothetical protein
MYVYSQLNGDNQEPAIEQDTLLDYDITYQLMATLVGTYYKTKVRSLDLVESENS